MEEGHWKGYQGQVHAEPEVLLGFGLYPKNQGKQWMNFKWEE